MSRLFSLILVAAMLVSLGGCADSQQQQRLQQHFAEMKRRLAQAEQELAALKKSQQGGAKADQISQLSRRQADLQADFDVFRSEFQALAGQLDEQSDQSGKLRADIDSLSQEQALKQKAMEERLLKLETGGQPPLSSPAAVVPPAPTPPSISPTTVSPSPPTAVPAATAVPAKTGESPIYHQALAAIRKEGDFSKGRQLLDRFVAENPESPLVVNARYWIGEAWYGEKKYENAILQFQDVIQDYGNHPKVAAALLKQALAFQALGDIPNTRVLLGKVVERFPNSPEAKKAQAKLAKLK